MPEKVIHEIRLNQYSAVPADRTRRFSLGTKDSYGIEQLRIVPGEGWGGLTITATFHPPEGEAVQVLVPADGLIDVPPEATRSGSELPLKYGKIVFAGVADGMQRISCNLPYTVMEHAPVDGAASSGPSPSWYEQAAAHFFPSGEKAGQVLAKASDADLDVEWADGGNGTADHAKLSNRDASDQHPISAITGLETALDAKQPAGSYLTQESDPTVPDWAKQPEKPSYTADEVGALSAATLPEAITTALAQATASGAFDGADGSPGKDGVDGKSAYKYAVDGGYTGTEEEFAAKMAQPWAYPVVGMTEAAAELLPNTYYRWGEVTALTVTLGAEIAGITNEYCFEFVSGETATELTVPGDIKWVQEPSIEAGKTYQVSILNGIGVIAGA